MFWSSHTAGAKSTPPLCFVQTMGKGSAYSFAPFHPQSSADQGTWDSGRRYAWNLGGFFGVCPSTGTRCPCIGCTQLCQIAAGNRDCYFAFRSFCVYSISARFVLPDVSQTGLYINKAHEQNYSCALLPDRLRCIYHYGGGNKKAPKGQSTSGRFETRKRRPLVMGHGYCNGYIIAISSQKGKSRILKTAKLHLR